MPLRRFWERSRPVAGAPGTRGLPVGAEEWLVLAQSVAAAGGRLLALWACPEGAPAPSGTVCAAYLGTPGPLVVELPVRIDAGQGAYPGLQELFPAASRLQRAAFDLTGIRASDPDARAWLDHGTWPLEQPLRAPSAAHRQAPTSDVPAPAAYPFVRVEGEGVHEIAVGPVHAGIIEPGHFRFSVVGEKVLRLEARLGYVHKGIERRFTELPLAQGHRLAARISGDSAVAFSWAYCQALEGLCGCEVPARAHWLRALLLELERIANHLGDLGALGNDAGFAFGLSQFLRLKERLLRAQQSALGQRYGLDLIVPGGVRTGLGGAAARELAQELTRIAAEVLRLREVYAEHAGLADRFAGAGRLEPELAARLGVLGLVARASGQRLDARVDYPCAPYDQLSPRMVVYDGGDVAARVMLRFEELQESARLVQEILGALPGGAHEGPLPGCAPGAFGVGLIEGWRGPAWVALEAGEDGRIRRCHAHDPSWQNWPALEHAILGNIVPDFPLINKSFNLSYSGADL